MEELIESTLEQCAKDGFTASAIEAALNTTEFHLRENNTGRFPRGLSLMLRAMGNWIYDKDPYEALQWTEPLNAFKVRHSLCHASLLDECITDLQTFRDYQAELPLLAARAANTAGDARMDWEQKSQTHPLPSGLSEVCDSAGV